MAATLTFPDDDNGDVLRRLQAGGDDLSKPRDIDFTVVLPTAEAADALARHFSAQGYGVESELSDCVAGLPWDVLVRKPMLPTHAGITAFEAELERVAGPLGGRNDGWGCFGQSR
jgi:hypothetical protein